MLRLAATPLPASPGETIHGSAPPARPAVRLAATLDQAPEGQARNGDNTHEPLDHVAALGRGDAPQLLKTETLSPSSGAAASTGNPETSTSAEMARR